MKRNKSLDNGQKIIVRTEQDPKGQTKNFLKKQTKGLSMMEIVVKRKPNQPAGFKANLNADMPGKQKKPHFIQSPEERKE